MPPDDEQRLRALLMNSNREPGASEEEIAVLEQQLGLALPDAYKTLLRLANGAGCRVGQEELLLYPISEVLDLYLRFREVTDGLLIFGGDGGGEAYVFDPRNGWSVGMMPWIPMGRQELKPHGHDLFEFLGILGRGEHWGNQRIG